MPKYTGVGADEVLVSEELSFPDASAMSMDMRANAGIAAAAGLQEEARRESTAAVMAVPWPKEQVVPVAAFLQHPNNQNSLSAPNMSEESVFQIRSEDPRRQLCSTLLFCEGWMPLIDSYF